MIEIETYVDGANQGVGKHQMEAAFQAVWAKHYQGTQGTVAFMPSHDLKRRPSGHPQLDRAAGVRNPDVFYWGRNIGPLLGVEITTHSPDGSNIEKRYPFLWSARRESLTAVVATPYLKVRPGGQVNRLPHRHAFHNGQLADAWNPADPSSSLQQLLPLTDLMGGDLRHVNAPIRDLMWSWDAIGAFLAHLTAARVSGGKATHALAALEESKKVLLELSRACMDATVHSEPSTLFRDGGRWIQVFNARPETGWWERGEGQFDSIDGRVMFTISELDLLPSDRRPESLELWLPQMTSRHPWILEQVAAGYGSKRFRNLAALLPNADMNVRFSLVFADQLGAEDWRILERNPGMCLERLVDPHSRLMRLIDFIPSGSAGEIANEAARGHADREPIRELVQNGDVWVSTARAYTQGWREELTSQATSAGPLADVYVPRIPQKLLSPVATPAAVRLLGGEACGRPLLLLLRYLYRHGHMPA